MTRAWTRKKTTLFLALLCQHSKQSINSVGAELCFSFVSYAICVPLFLGEVMPKVVLRRSRVIAFRTVQKFKIAYDCVSCICIMHLFLLSILSSILLFFRPDEPQNRVSLHQTSTERCDADSTAFHVFSVHSSLCDD